MQYFTIKNSIATNMHNNAKVLALCNNYVRYNKYSLQFL